MTVQITVLGLGRIGVSIGLALAERKGQILRVGNDRDPRRTRDVAGLGAFDQVQHNLPSAVERADAVVLAVPVDEVRKALEEFAPDLKPGAVVIDTSPLQVSAMQWAAGLLPAERYFLSMTPTLNPLYLEETGSGAGAPHADLFKDGLMLIAHLPGVVEGALKLAADLATLLGASPYFADPWEADGLLAAAHILPRLAAAALANAVVDQPGWIEGRKLAGRAFAQATAPVLDPDEAKELGQAALHNKENTLRVLDNLAAELDALRQAIAAGDAAQLAERLERARQSRIKWWGQRSAADWVDQKPEPLPGSREFLGQLVGLGRRKKT